MSKIMCPMAEFKEYCFENKCGWWIESDHIQNSDGSPCGRCAIQEIALTGLECLSSGLPIRQ